MNDVTVVSFDPRRDRTLRPEMTTTVRIAIETREGVLALPRRAVRREQGRAFVLTPAGERRFVKVGSRDETHCEIVDGLREGDEVWVGRHDRATGHRKDLPPARRRAGRGARRRLAAHRARRLHGDRRHLGLGQVDAHERARPAGQPGHRPLPARRRRRGRPRRRPPGPAAEPQDWVRVPGLSPAAADDRGERRRRAGSGRSRRGGVQPAWSKDGKELYYLALDGKIMAVAVKPGSAFAAGLPVSLFESGLRPEGLTESRSSFVVSDDGQRFLVNTLAEEAAHVPITVVVNWAAGLRK